MDQFASMGGINTPYMEELFNQYQQNPKSVSLEWRTFFESVERGVDMASKNVNLTKPVQSKVTDHDLKTQSVAQMIDVFRNRGHKRAQIDPLGSQRSKPFKLADFNLSDADLSSTFATDGLLAQSEATLKDILEALQHTYTSSIGVQYTQVQHPEERAWLRQQMESVHNKPVHTKNCRQEALDILMRAEKFEQFLHTKFVGKKRFSGEGADSLLPMLRQMVRKCGDHGVHDIVMGMAHRARLGVLVHFLEKPVEQIFAGFDETLVIEDETTSSDVKYHMGRSTDITLENGHQVHVSLLNNPSHLEAVNPVIAGSARAKQERWGELGKKKVLPVVIHGDSAIAGQGVVMETLNLANLDGYTNGGTVHIVINNQIGFTARPEEVFSGEYCTDVARMLQVPIFHVNGDDVDACLWVMQLAMDYRAKFGKDVVIDLVCYRKYGHNEGDDPSFTSPHMYQKIRAKQTVYSMYKEQLREQGLVTKENMADHEKKFTKNLQQAFLRAREDDIALETDMFGGAWQDYQKKGTKEPKTAISGNLLKEISQCFEQLPKEFTPNPKIKKGMDKRAAMLLGQESIDWGAAEVAAYASLVSEGTSVRLSGQDVRRGTFSHRHLALWDRETDTPYFPAASLARHGARLEAHNSSLSELAVLGFEYGYSLAAPETLTIWEAQFGDFANGAQITFDQFISCSEHKWNRMSGLVVLLPHGYEGQGPEHSSARVERYLQLCAQDNMVVVMPTTPAQMFHILRRQMHDKIRKPLIVFTPKSLLRHPLAVSQTADITRGSFSKILVEGDAKKAKKVVLCSGKIYYDLLAEKQKAQRDDVVLVRVEQLYPTPVAELKKALPPKADFVWAQEEPKNMGAWRFVREAIGDTLGVNLRYIGRDASASPAVGHHKVHLLEQQKIIKEIFED